MSWYPIDTAPKDGAWILVWGPGSNVRDAAWYSPDGLGGWYEGGNEFIEPKMTHWMPLPEPPEQS